MVIIEVVGKHIRQGGYSGSFWSLLMYLKILGLNKRKTDENKKGGEESSGVFSHAGGMCID
jgi:hypothetical protein